MAWVRFYLCTPKAAASKCSSPGTGVTGHLFAFKGQACQYKVLLFGLSLSPRVFTEVVEAAVASLREVGT